MANSQKFIGAFRELLVGLGAVLVAFMPGVESLWNEIAGLSIAAAALGWAIKDKTLTQDVLLTTFRKLITFVGIVFAAKIPAEVLSGIATAGAFILPVVWQYVEKKK